MITRLARPDDVEVLGQLRAALWPDGSAEDHARDVNAILAGEWSRLFPYVVLVAEEDQAIAGFADVTMRSYADGCDPGAPVGYLEGWYVVESQRRHGIGAELLRAAENWARAQGCTEMASDTWIDNEGAQRAHEALGFEVVDRCVNYRKAL